MKRDYFCQTDFLKEIHYDSGTGIFTRKSTGKRAGAKTQHGYRVLHFRNSRFYEHRLAWFLVYGAWPENEIDHINGIRDDNRAINLRKANRMENAANINNPRPNKTGYQGVWPVNGRFSSMIRISGKRVYLGCFGTAIEAHLAFVEASKKLKGTFCPKVGM